MPAPKRRLSLTRLCLHQPDGGLIGSKVSRGRVRVVAHQQGGPPLHQVKMGHGQGARGEIGEQQQGVGLAGGRIPPPTAVADALWIITIEQLEVAVANDGVGLAQCNQLAIVVKQGVGAGLLLGGVDVHVVVVERNPGGGGVLKPA